ncbi:MAG: hypothetical protein MZU95_09740 [Desulfomicrobium escambiense]|nr:hypothetical protein [Desulfomicrobium escambiense]
MSPSDKKILMLVLDGLGGLPDENRQDRTGGRPHPEYGQALQGFHLRALHTDGRRHHPGQRTRPPWAVRL